MVNLTLITVVHLLEVLLGDVSAAGADAGEGATDADVALEAHDDGAVHGGHHGDL